MRLNFTRLWKDRHLVTVSIGQCGLYLETTCEVVPVVVSTTIAAALLLYDASTALSAVVLVLSKQFLFSLVS
jgi:hypothetical protein